MIREIKREASSGYIALLALIGGTLALGYAFYRAVLAQSPVQIVVLVVLTIFLAIAWAGFFLVNPNEAKVLQLFGKYVGSVKTTGLRYANPFYTKRRVSLRVRNSRPAN